MTGRRENLIASFALRFLFDNLDSEIFDALNSNLSSEDMTSLEGEEELIEIADSFFGEPEEKKEGADKQ